VRDSTDEDPALQVQSIHSRARLWARGTPEIEKARGTQVESYVVGDVSFEGKECAMFDRQRLLREVNNRIAEIGGEERLDKLDFFCECGSEDCVASVEISVEDYAQTAEASFILADGHDRHKKTWLTRDSIRRVHSTVDVTTPAAALRKPSGFWPATRSNDRRAGRSPLRITNDPPSAEGRRPRRRFRSPSWEASDPSAQVHVRRLPTRGSNPLSAVRGPAATLCKQRRSVETQRQGMGNSSLYGRTSQKEEGWDSSRSTSSSVIRRSRR
jgi:hypothetical protein